MGSTRKEIIEAENDPDLYLRKIEKVIKVVGINRSPGLRIQFYE